MLEFKVNFLNKIFIFNLINFFKIIFILVTGTCSDGNNEIKADKCYIDDKNCFKIKNLSSNAWMQTWLPYVIAVVVLVGLPIFALASYKMINN